MLSVGNLPKRVFRNDRLKTPLKLVEPGEGQFRISQRCNCHRSSGVKAQRGHVATKPRSCLRNPTREAMRTPHVPRMPSRRGSSGCSGWLWWCGQACGGSVLRPPGRAEVPDLAGEGGKTARVFTERLSPIEKKAMPTTALRWFMKSARQGIFQTAGDTDVVHASMKYLHLMSRTEDSNESKTRK